MVRATVGDTQMGTYPEMLMVRWSIMCGCLATSRVYLQASDKANRLPCR
jgi:hypothetical protein